MKRANVIKVCIIAAVIVGSVVIYAIRTREPVYRGRSLSFWFGQLGTTNSGEAVIALREMGPAAVPVLLKKARSEDGDSLYEKLYRTIYCKVPRAVQRRMSLPKPYDITFHLFRVANSLQLLGPPAMPELIRWMADANNNVRLTALRAITVIDPMSEATVPVRIRLVNDPDGRIRVQAVISLGLMKSARKRAMPELIGALNDSDRGPGPGEIVYVRANAARVLGEIGPEAISALPGLNKALGARDSNTRVHAAIATWRIAHDVNIIPVLITELDTADVPTCSWILSAFGEMGPVAKQAIPAILRKVESSRGVSNVHGIDLSSVGLKALEKIDAETATAASGK